MKASKLSDAQGAHSEAGYGWHSGGGDLPPRQDQPSDLLQLEKEI